MTLGWAEYRSGRLVAICWIADVAMTVLGVGTLEPGDSLEIRLNR